MEEALIKGRGFNSAQAVRRRHAGERLATLLAMVPEDTRKLLEFPPSAAEWIPMRHSRDLVEASAALIYENPQDMIRAGYDQVRADLKGVYQILVKVASPEYAMARFRQAWATYYRNNGTIEMLRPRERCVQFMLKGFAYPSPAYWATIHGAFLAFVEATRVREPQLQLTSGGGASPNATFEVCWSR